MNKWINNFISILIKIISIIILAITVQPYFSGIHNLREYTSCVILTDQCRPDQSVPLTCHQIATNTQRSREKRETGQVFRQSLCVCPSSNGVL